ATWRPGEVHFTVHVGPRIVWPAVFINDSSLFSDATMNWDTEELETWSTSAWFVFAEGIARPDGRADFGIVSFPAICSLDGGPFAECQSPVAYANLPAGLHSFTLKPRDIDPQYAANQSAFATYKWRIFEAAAPALHLPDAIAVEATGPDGARVTFAVSATDAVDVTDA